MLALIVEEPSAQRFEDLIIWQNSRNLVKVVFERFSKLEDRNLSSQIYRAAVSVMNNLAEGYERRTRPEWRHFPFIAKASAGEVRSLLYILLNLVKINKEQFDELKAQKEEILRMKSGLIVRTQS